MSTLKIVIFLFWSYLNFIQLGLANFSDTIGCYNNLLQELNKTYFAQSRLFEKQKLLNIPDEKLPYDMVRQNIHLEDTAKKIMGDLQLVQTSIREKAPVEKMNLNLRIDALFALYPEHGRQAEKLEDYHGFPLIGQELLLETMNTFTNTMKSLIVRSGIPLSSERGFYVSKLQVENGDEFISCGDLHGSGHSLGRNIKRLIQQGILNEEGRIIDPEDHKNFIIFTGDYADRGRLGIECWFIIMTLKILNPERVILLRGNHETAEVASAYGFANEISAKYPGDNRLILSMYRIFDLLPSALVISHVGAEDKQAIIVTHGGVPLHFDLERWDHKQEVNYFYFFLKQLLERTDLKAHFFNKGEFPTCLKYLLWNDVDLRDIYERNCVYTGFRGADELLASVSEIIRQLKENLQFDKMALIRGHQHIPSITTGLMQKVQTPQGERLELQQLSYVYDVFESNPLYTLNSCPEAIGGLLSDTKSEDAEGCSVLTVGATNQDTWQLKAFHFPLPSKRDNTYVFQQKNGSFGWIDL